MTHIYILGSGAMGSLWASYLYPNHSLYFIQRIVQSDVYTFTVEPNKLQVKGHCLAATSLNTRIDQVIVTTKAYDALAALKSIKPHLSHDAQVILLQNGLGSQQAIAAQFPELRLYACSSTEGAYKKDTNTLVHAGKGVNTIGPLNPCATEQLLQAWLPSQHYVWHDDIEHVLWRKFMINCAINPLTALYDCKNGELISQPAYFTHMQHICNEIDVVTHAQNFSIDAALTLAQHVCQSTANNISSMLQDKRNGNLTELNYMTGYLLQKAQVLGIQCPYNQALYDQLNHV